MRLGRSREAHLIAMSSLWSGFSKVAAGNAYAQFPEARSAEFLAAPSAENYPVADPYLKWHVAQDAVNQGAAVILTSVGEAERLGISPEKWIFLHGYAQARDRFVTERQDLSRSKAIELVIPTALEMAGKSPSDIQYFDLYSCFPCAVFLAAEALALDAGRVPLTVTGGLPFFGGAGNNYSMHAIVSMVEKLRADRQAYGLVLANGGFLSKEAAGIYSAQPVENWQPSTVDLQPEIDALAAPQLLEESCDAQVETYTVTYTKGVPQRAYIIARNEKGRILGRIRNGDQQLAQSLAENDPTGRTARFEHEDGTNFLVGIQ
jgi:acetyl-CoA C-acetyltransferase